LFRYVNVRQRGVTVVLTRHQHRNHQLTRILHSTLSLNCHTVAVFILSQRGRVSISPARIRHSAVCSWPATALETDTSAATLRFARSCKRIKPPPLGQMRPGSLHHVQDEIRAILSRIKQGHVSVATNAAESDLGRVVYAETRLWLRPPHLSWRTARQPRCRIPCCQASRSPPRRDCRSTASVSLFRHLPPLHR
jgi:hypothetical protein